MVGLMAWARAAITPTLGFPYSPSSAWSWRLVLEMHTSSASIRVSRPMPLRASASAAHEPTPPTPITQTWARASAATLPVPYRRSTPAKRSAVSSISFMSACCRRCACLGFSLGCLVRYAGHFIARGIDAGYSVGLAHRLRKHIHARRTLDSARTGDRRDRHGQRHECAECAQSDAEGGDGDDGL